MPRVDTRYPIIRARHERDNLAALGKVFEEQQDDVSARGRLAKRWDAVLAGVVFDRNRSTAREVGPRVARAFGEDFDPDVMDPWLQVNAGIAAELINQSTRDRLEESDEEDRIAHVFGILLTSRVAMYARSLVNTSANFAARDAAASSGAELKRWQVNSNNPRSAHRAMRGQTVAIGSTFSNGLKWPGDPSGAAKELANCRCSLTLL